MVTMTTPDVNIVVIDFKTSKGKEMVVPNEDGSYTILINSRLSYDSQLKAYKHAMRHINNNDFEKSDVQPIECSAHELSSKEEFPVPAQQYVDRIKKLQAERRQTQRQMKKDQERVQFIIDNCDMFRRAENLYLYGDNL